MLHNVYCIYVCQSGGSPAEFKFQRAADEFVQLQTNYSFSCVIPVPVSSMAFSLNKQILVSTYLHCSIIV